MIHHGDCLEVMAEMEPESVDAVVTDPPYGLGFMGKAWDDAKRLASVPPSAIALAATGRDPYPKTGKGPSAVAFDGHAFQGWCEAWGREAYRVAKPSAYLLAFGGTRTVHRMTVALEDAGWIIRDMLVWAYASGFPKSKASLKPAWEPIVMARKPGPLRMLAIDECRIGTGESWTGNSEPTTSANGYGPGDSDGWSGTWTKRSESNPVGRWPANVILTDPIFDGGIEGVVGGGETPAGDGRDWSGGPVHGSGGVTGFVGTKPTGKHFSDSGTYSRFFLIPKADRADREPVLGGLPLQAVVKQVPLNNADYEYSDGSHRSQNRPRANNHPTVKPVDLMRHLIRLVTPTGGVVLDPFLGSGTTAIAAEMEGFEWIGIEKELEYVRIAEARLNGTQRGLGLPA